MKNVISQLIDDFHERNLPELVTRDKEFSEVRGKADVVIGMRRAGKTWFCYQKIKELIASGIKKEEILYLNFEDDRLLEFNVNNRISSAWYEQRRNSIEGISDYGMRTFCDCMY